MVKNFLDKMSRFQKIVEKTFKIKNYDPFLYTVYENDFKILGLKYPSSRMSSEPCEPKAKTDYNSVVKNTNKFLDIERIIGLDFPDSRFKK